MRRMLSGIAIMLTLLAAPSFAFAGAPAVSTPDAKPAAQVPVLKVISPSPSADKAIAETPEVIGVRWANHVDAVTGVNRLRLVLDVSKPIITEANVLASPNPKLVVTLKGTAVGKLEDGLSFDGSIAEQASAYLTPGGDTRLLIDVPLMLEDSDYRIFTLKADAKANRPFRVVIDINRKAPAIEYNFKPGLKNKVVVLDPGHGGSDPGAIGAGRTQEKMITLAVAMQAKTLLERSGAQVIMTRQDDRDVFGPNASATEELNARTTIANNRKADVFVSIHINSFQNRAAGGTSAYFYQKTPYDAMLAQNLQSSLLRAGGLQDRGVNSANFYVIKRTVMPASLVELAFISNPDEEKLLNNNQFQQKIAQSIVQGLDRFFTQAAK